MEKLMVFEISDELDEEITNISRSVADAYFKQNGMEDIAEEHDDTWYETQELLREDMLNAMANRLESTHKSIRLHKEFTSGKTSISRLLLESCICPFMTEDTTDETMQGIADRVEEEMKEWYEWEKDGSVTSDKVEDMWWSFLEKEVVAAGIPYYEDIKE